MRTGIALATRRIGSAIRPGHAWGAVRQARAFSTAPETVETVEKRHNRFPELGGANQIFPGAPSPLQEFSVVYTDRAVSEPPRRAHRNEPPPPPRPPSPRSLKQPNGLHSLPRSCTPYPLAAHAC